MAASDSCVDTFALVCLYPIALPATEEGLQDTKGFQVLSPNRRSAPLLHSDGLWNHLSPKMSTANFTFLTSTPPNPPVPEPSLYSWQRAPTGHWLAKGVGTAQRLGMEQKVGTWLKDIPGEREEAKQGNMSGPKIAPVAESHTPANHCYYCQESKHCAPLGRCRL